MPENNENSWEQMLSLDEVLEFHFKDALDYTKTALGVDISPEEIACFCRENFIGYPKLFTMQLFEIISETIIRKCKHPDVRYFQAPKWLDVKSKKISLSAGSPEELKAKLPNLKEKTETNPNYKSLARIFLSSYGS